MKRLPIFLILCLLCWLPSHASMIRLPSVQEAQAFMVIGSVADDGEGISFTNLDDGSGTSNPQSTGSITPTADSQVFVAVAMSISTGVPTEDLTVSGGNLSWTHISYRTYGTRRMIHVFRGTGASPSTGSLSIEYTGTGTFQEVFWSVDEATGVDSTTPNDNAVAAFDAGVTSLAVGDVGTPGAGDFTYGAFALEGGSSSASPDSGTQLSYNGSGTGVRELLVYYDGAASPDETPSITWTGSCDAGAIGMIINAE